MSDITVAIHPAAIAHLPGFITPPGETDIMLVNVGIGLLLTLLLAGNLFFRLHALPERVAHRTGKAQLQVVGVLVLLSLFTHNHLLWIAALLLAFIELPDISRPFASIAASLERMSGRGEGLAAPAEGVDPDAPPLAPPPASTGALAAGPSSVPIRALPPDPTAADRREEKSDA